MITDVTVTDTVWFH